MARIQPSNVPANPSKLAKTTGLFMPIFVRSQKTLFFFECSNLASIRQCLVYKHVCVRACGRVCVCVDFYCFLQSALGCVLGGVRLALLLFGLIWMYLALFCSNQKG